MKALLKFIEERLTEEDPANGSLQNLFTAKIPKKGFSEKWLFKALTKHGPRLLSKEAWLQSIPRTHPLTTIGDLASHLHLGVSELEWFADLQQRNPNQRPLHHYRYRWIPRKKGPPRLLMEPKESLKITQRRILETILNDIPLHEAAHALSAVAPSRPSPKCTPNNAPFYGWTSRISFPRFPFPESPASFAPSATATRSRISWPDSAHTNHPGRWLA